MRQAAKPAAGANVCRRQTKNTHAHRERRAPSAERHACLHTHRRASAHPVLSLPPLFFLGRSKPNLARASHADPSAPYDTCVHAATHAHPKGEAGKKKKTCMQGVWYLPPLLPRAYTRTFLVAPLRRMWDLCFLHGFTLLLPQKDARPRLREMIKGGSSRSIDLAVSCLCLSMRVLVCL